MNDLIQDQHLKDQMRIRREDRMARIMAEERMARIMENSVRRIRDINPNDDWVRDFDRAKDMAKVLSKTDNWIK